VRACPILVIVLVLNDPPTRQAWRDSSGVAQGAVASGRISNQLVAADQDPCTSDNGGRSLHSSTFRLNVNAFC